MAGFDGFDGPGYGSGVENMPETEMVYCWAFKQWFEECLDQGSKIGSNHVDSVCHEKFELFYTKNFYLAFELLFRGDKAGFGLR